jgi:hypothetical protein
LRNVGRRALPEVASIIASPAKLEKLATRRRWRRALNRRETSRVLQEYRRRSTGITADRFEITNVFLDKFALAISALLERKSFPQNLAGRFTGKTENISREDDASFLSPGTGFFA